MGTRQKADLPAPILTVRGEFGEGLADLVEKKVATIARHAHEPVLAVRVELDRHTDPAVSNPVTAKADVDLNGRHFRATATDRTAVRAVDMVIDRVTRQMDAHPHAHRWRRR